MRLVAAGILCLSLAGDASSQLPPQSTFEVASVKPSPPDAQGMFTRVLPDGSVRIAGATLKNLIAFAYSVRGFQIAGGPNWIETERYDVEARVVTSEATTPLEPQQVSREQRKTGERVRSLLADRFQLALHPETREQPVYALVVARGGTKLDESTESGGMIRMMGRGKLKGQAVGLSLLVLNLSNELGRRVIDRTGLTAKYNFELKWTPAQPSAAALSQPADPDVPSIFTVLQEQLGLRLESEKGPVEFLVIYRVQRPTQN